MRRLPSNRMPSYEEPPLNLTGAVLLCTWCALMAVLAWSEPSSLLLFAIAVAVTTVWHVVEKRRDRKTAESRQGESLCSFVRDFDFRQIDTWVLRAVYEQVQPLVDFPIRADDNLHKDLHLASDDLDDITNEVAARTGRSLESTSTNPKYGRVLTVRDVVLFFNSQPKEGHQS